MDGILGIAPDDPSNGPSFISSLMTGKVITSKVFGLLITPAAVTASAITIGGYDSSMMSTNYMNIHWEPLYNTSRWYMKVNDLRIGLYSFKSSKVLISLLDTFYRTILLPTSEFNNLVNYYRTQYSYVICNNNTVGGSCYFLGQCSAKIPNFANFRIQFNDTCVFGIPPEYYMLQTTMGGQSIC